MSVSDPVRYEERLHQMRTALTAGEPWQRCDPGSALVALIDLLLEMEQHLDRSTQ